MSHLASVPERLAIEGGPLTRTRPFAPWPVFAADERAAVDAVLASGRVNYWTGDQGTQFEDEFAAHLGVTHAVALANGTLALEVALHALGIGPGDEVVVPAKTFVATASCVVACGARPIFCDVGPNSQNMTADAVRSVLTPRTRAVIPVHLAGWPCDMDPLLELVHERSLALIEDCAQAMGATYKGRALGGFGDCAAFSFCQDKIMTTGGEGGMFVTPRQDLWNRAWAYKDHGKSYEAVQRAQAAGGHEFKWLHESFGSNYRMTEVQAAIGRVQLKRLAEWVALRRANAAVLTDGLRAIPGLRVARPDSEAGHSYYKYYAFVEPDRLRPGWDLSRVIDAINAEGVPCLQGACSEVYREAAFVKAGLAPAQPRPVAARLSRTAIMFTVHPTLVADDMRDTVRAVAKVMRAAVQG